MSGYRENQAPFALTSASWCWRTTSPVEGLCCGVPMVHVENEPEIVAELRKKAKAKKESAGAGGGSAGWPASRALIAVALHVVLIATRRLPLAH